ncbi:hypothetical protein MROS_2000 [Melioribacter roseus P3M-2]|uniref:Uncharacterized protein n=1 Tax=Melioribacter roseus (strain DSM 23840 / JCM 17771 / VKM B-2668 / P3M-2) TaxID=1191523 RepID=I6YXB7_MELRP|nr:hypothetical protein [Melioribacter roseus]AFN75232.1 hypothetical protein MROS_2000 [Melioribacter roseus P3M-2]
MTAALLMALHLIFIAYIFALKYQEESIGSAFLNVALIIILFTVGWSISSSIVKIFFDSEGISLELNADTISLILLSIAEFFFYRFYYGQKATEAGTEM